jgi:hypothetical protein
VGAGLADRGVRDDLVWQIPWREQQRVLPDEDEHDHQRAAELERHDAEHEPTAGRAECPLAQPRIRALGWRQPGRLRLELGTIQKQPRALANTRGFQPWNELGKAAHDEFARDVGHHAEQREREEGEPAALRHSVRLGQQAEAHIHIEDVEHRFGQAESRRSCTFKGRRPADARLRLGLRK